MEARQTSRVAGCSFARVYSVSTARGIVAAVCVVVFASDGWSVDRSAIETLWVFVAQIAASLRHRVASAQQVNRNPRQALL